MVCTGRKTGWLIKILLGATRPRLIHRQVVPAPSVSRLVGFLSGSGVDGVARSGVGFKAFSGELVWL